MPTFPLSREKFGGGKHLTSRESSALYSLLNEAAGASEDSVIVNSATDLPEAVDGIVTLAEGVYEIRGHIDLGANHLEASDATIVGLAPEKASITSSSAAGVISLVGGRLNLRGVGIYGTGGSAVSIPSEGAAGPLFAESAILSGASSAPTVLVEENISEVIFDMTEVLGGSKGLKISGELETVTLRNCFFAPGHTAAYTALDFDAAEFDSGSFVNNTIRFTEAAQRAVNVTNDTVVNNSPLRFFNNIFDVGSGAVFETLSTSSAKMDFKANTGALDTLPGIVWTRTGTMGGNTDIVTQGAFVHIYNGLTSTVNLNAVNQVWFTVEDTVGSNQIQHKVLKYDGIEPATFLVTMAVTLSDPAVGTNLLFDIALQRNSDLISLQRGRLVTEYVFSSLTIPVTLQPGDLLRPMIRNSTSDADITVLSITLTVNRLGVW